MSEEKKNVEVVENDEMIIEEVKKSKVKELISKAKVGVKKHGPKIAAGAVAVGVGIIGYALGKGFDSKDFEYGDNVESHDNMEENDSENDSEE